MLKLMKSPELNGFKAKLAILAVLFMGLFVMASEESQNTTYLSIIPDNAVEGFVQQAIIEKASQVNKDDKNIDKYVEQYKKYISNN
ncbi:MAG: hypothetical protein DWQ06_04735 [Calditrichaeota bacterium]|nr:MAG: hypothetical protein DWQ06_04735 [Calditrichota bacterium]